MTLPSYMQFLLDLEPEEIVLEPIDVDRPFGLLEVIAALLCIRSGNAYLCIREIDIYRSVFPPFPVRYSFGVTPVSLWKKRVKKVALWNPSESAIS